MNDQIFELAKRADLIQRDTLPSGARTPDHESVVKANKFAELIVRECADLAYKTSWDDLLQAHCQAVLPLHLYNTIKQHFGVE